MEQGAGRGGAPSGAQCARLAVCLRRSRGLGNPGYSAPVMFSSAVSNVVFNVKWENGLFVVAAKEPFRFKKRAEGPIFLQIRYRLNENSAATCIEIVVRLTSPRCGVNNWPGRSSPRPS